ncbi:hypothetical protein TcYC6_0001730 [Trypanosoma cruzi]|nr:hypothetical protein TcYC6_0001730 [Trypanosoma cruzi]
MDLLQRRKGVQHGDNRILWTANIIKALGKAKMWREMPSGLLIVELVVEPLRTEPYLEGVVTDGFDLRFRALPT